MTRRDFCARRRGWTTAAACALALASSLARAETLHATYGVSLIGVPIGLANVNATLSATSYSIEASAKLTGLASAVANARGASAGRGAIVNGHVAPATFATTASNAVMTRTIRMALANNAVTGVDISPPFVDKPDRVPLGPADERGVVDPVGAFVIAAPPGSPTLSAAACNRTIPIFDGWTRFDIALSYVGERTVAAKGYSGPVAVCSARYVPIAGHRRDRPATKFMAENKNLEVWLAPIEPAHVLLPFRISVLTMIGTTVVEANEFRIDHK
jgi:hypothetical protein